MSKHAQLTERQLLQAYSQAAPFTVPHRSHCIEVEVTRVARAVEALSQSVHQLLWQSATDEACDLSSSRGSASLPQESFRGVAVSEALSCCATSLTFAASATVLEGSCRNYCAVRNGLHSLVCTSDFVHGAALIFCAICSGVGRSDQVMLQHLQPSGARRMHGS